MRMPKGFFLPSLFFSGNLFLVAPRILQTIVWPIVWIFLKIFGRLTPTGKENLRGCKRGAIFAVNHVSELDPFLIPTALGPLSPLMPMFYVSRERDFYEIRGITRHLYGGFVFRIFGAYPAIPKIKNYDLMLPHHIKILQSGRSICIFPEGELNRSDELLKKGQLGVAYLCWKTGSPVIPTAVYGHKGMSWGDFLAFRRKVVVSYGQPISKESLFGARNSIEPPTHDELIAAVDIIMSCIRVQLVACGARTSAVPSGASDAFLS